MRVDTIKIAIADDNKEFVKTMVTYFERHPEIEIIWTAHNGKVCLVYAWKKKSQMYYYLTLLCPILDGIAVLETLSGNA